MHAQKLVERAADALDQRRHDMAIELYLQAVTLEPDHLEARKGLRKAELAKYEAYYPSALTRLFGTLGARIAAGFAKILKNHEKRMIACEKILRKDPRNTAVSMALAEAALAAGHEGAAIAAYHGILVSEPEHLEALKGIGRLLYRRGEIPAALEAYEKAVKLDPRDQEAARMRKNLAAEISITKTGIDRAQHSRDVLRDRTQVQELEESARLVRGRDEIEKAVKGIEEKVREEPDNPRLQAELGARYAALNRFDEAIAAYERAFELERTNFSHREKAGDLRIRRYERKIRDAVAAGDEALARALREERLAFLVEEYRARVREHPTDLVLHFQLGKALYETGDLDGAIGEFQQTVRDPRRKIESLTMLGNCFLGKGMYDLAENQLQKALDEMPGMSDRSKDILYALGNLKEKQEKFEEALAQYKRIYEVDIGFRDVAERIQSLKQRIGES